NRLVEGLIQTVMESTQTILKNPADYDARANMMWAATLGFNGLSSAGMGKTSLPVHMMEHSLSALYDIAHGAGLSIVLPAWMLYVVKEKPAHFARPGREIFGIAEQDDLKAGTAAIARLKEWFASIGCPVSLEGAQIPGKDIEKIAKNAYALAQVWGLKDYYTEEVIADILMLCK
ncbi:MAG: iron-containing alcohol dehydrogenase, partial [Syntrophales bacterium]|nr:iron-containing alcohol dehydrogenase [Syntrophales bacterium]